MNDNNKRLGDDRRSPSSRRTGIDPRPDEQKLQTGERRLKADRRAGGDRRAERAEPLAEAQSYSPPNDQGSNPPMDTPVFRNTD
jgi:hypothetical protein